jgi:hypothetical protein
MITANSSLIQYYPTPSLLPFFSLRMSVKSVFAFALPEAGAPLPLPLSAVRPPPLIHAKTEPIRSLTLERKLLLLFRLLLLLFRLELEVPFSKLRRLGVLFAFGPVPLPLSSPELPLFVAPLCFRISALTSTSR